MLFESNVYNQSDATLNSNFSRTNHCRRVSRRINTFENFIFSPLHKLLIFYSYAYVFFHEKEVMIEKATCEHTYLLTQAFFKLHYFFDFDQKESEKTRFGVIKT